MGIILTVLSLGLLSAAICGVPLTGWSLVLSLIYLVAACFILWRKPMVVKKWHLFMFGGLLMSFILIALPFERPGMYVASELYGILHLRWTFAAAVLVLFAYLAYPKAARFRRSAFFVLIAGAMLFRFGMPLVSPAPVIDVFRMSQDSAQNLLAGMNPYVTPVPNVYVPGTTMPGYVYLPGVLYLQTLGAALFSDIRYILIVAQAVTAFILYWLARRRWPVAVAELFPLLYLYHPRALFMLEQAWTEPLIILCFALAVYALERNRRYLSALAFGYGLSMKQYLVMFPLHWLLLERKPKYLLSGLGLAILTAVPFLLLDAHIFLREGVIGQVSVPFRWDGMTVYNYFPSLLQEIPFIADVSAEWGTYGMQREPHRWLTGAVGMVFGLLTFLLFRKKRQPMGFLASAALTTFAMFFLGRHALLNYYSFVLFLLIALLAAGPEPASSPRVAKTPAKPKKR